METKKIDFKKYSKMSFKNREEIEKSSLCGCYYCGRIFTPDKITEDDWMDEMDGHETLLCPYCGIDSVIYETEDTHLTPELLKEIGKIGFGFEE